MLNLIINKFRNSIESSTSIFKKSRRVAACAAVCAITVAGALAAPADFDRTFGSNGRVFTANNTAVYSTENMKVTAGGKILVLSNVFFNNVKLQPALFQYNPDGSPDTNFGTSGKVLVDVGNVNSISDSLLVQPDGKIIVSAAFETGSTSSDFVVLRYNSNGSPDTNFGTNGKIITYFEAGVNIEYITDSILQPDGKIVLSGSISSSGSPDKASLARLTTNGDLDTTFGTGGRLVVTTTGSNPDINSLSVQSDGKIIAAGMASNDFLIMRFNANGANDGTFGTGGEVNLPFGNLVDEASKVLVQPDGKILVAGRFSTQADKREFALARLRTNGTTDPFFGNSNSGKNAVIFNNPQSEVTDLILQPDGKIVLTGSTGDSPSDSKIFAAARFNADGSIDSGFGSAGKATLTLGNAGLSSGAALLPNGRILLAGVSFTGGAVNKQIALAKILGKNTAGDFDSDGKADLTVYRPSNGSWYSLRSSAGFAAVTFGAATDKPVSADYDGDGTNDVAVFRPSNGTWYILNSSNNQFRAVQFGTNADTPQPADFDGDNKADIAVFRPAANSWHILQSSNNQVRSVTWGAILDKPVAADYDRDGKADVAVFRPSNGTWYVLSSKDNSIKSAAFGMNGDVPQAADYDGDLAADYAVFRPSDGGWYVLRSSDNQFQAAQFGASGDVPAAKDYDGDGRADYAVFRPSSGTWHIFQTVNGYTGVQWGATGDAPAN